MIKSNKILEFLRIKNKGEVKKTIPLFSEVISATISKVRRGIQDIIWSVAIASDITPKKIAKNLADPKKLEKFAGEVVKEIDKVRSKVEKDLSQEGIKITKKRGRPRKTETTS